MSNANTPEMMAKSMAESLFRENASLKEEAAKAIERMEVAERYAIILIEEKSALKEQNALLTVQVQEGWKLVPVEPTAVMIIAAVDGYETGEVFGPASCYRVMLAAAPALPQQVKSEDARDAEQLIEKVAKTIYEGWSEREGYVPWQEGGNSNMQDLARARARAAISAQD